MLTWIFLTVINILILSLQIYCQIRPDFTNIKYLQPAPGSEDETEGDFIDLK